MLEFGAGTRNIEGNPETIPCAYNQAVIEVGAAFSTQSGFHCEVPAKAGANGLNLAKEIRGV